MIKEPDALIGKNLYLWRRDSALDWAIYFAEQNNSSVGLVHRSDTFRAHKDSVEKAYQLQKDGKIDLYTHAEVVGLKGEQSLQAIEIKQKINPIK